MRRLAVMAHYDRHNRVDDHVFCLAKGIAKHCSDFLFVSTASLSVRESRRMSEIGMVVCRDNVGYDFGSWQHGLRLMDPLDAYDEIVVCNDSIYGPLFDLGIVFRAMEHRPVDIWGMTSNSQFAYHLQSFFLVFRRKAVTHSFFDAFWSSVAPQPTKLDVILKYEVGLSQQAAAAGLRLGTYFEPGLFDRATIVVRHFINPTIRSKKCSAFDIYNTNYTHVIWDRLMRKGMPFVKVELMRDNPFNMPLDKIYRAIARRSGYDPDLIRRHVATMLAEARA